MTRMRVWMAFATLAWAGWLAPLPAARAADMPVYTLTFKTDGTFEPARLEVPAGRFKIVLVNESTEAVEFESLPLRKEKVLGPGVTSFVVLSLSRPGEYPFFDDFHPQVKGTLVVLPKPRFSGCHSIMEQVAFIVWRECVEALLVIGILYSWLRASPEGRRGLPWLWGGVAAGLVLAGALALVLLGVSSWLSDEGQEWFQALMALVACGLVVQMVVWMRAHGRGLKRELESGAAEQVGHDHWWGLLILAMIAVAREGSEAVVFLYGSVLSSQGDGGVGAMVLAGLGGFAAALLTFWLLQLGGRIITWRRFFKLTEILLLLLAGALLVSATDRLISLEPSLSHY